MTIRAPYAFSMPSSKPVPQNDYGVVWAAGKLRGLQVLKCMETVSDRSVIALHIILLRRWHKASIAATFLFGYHMLLNDPLHVSTETAGTQRPCQVHSCEGCLP
jgi:hypothetical protein